MTVSAPVRLTPTPPERVDKIKQKIRRSALKRSIKTYKFKNRNLLEKIKGMLEYTHNLILHLMRTTICEASMQMKTLL